MTTENGITQYDKKNNIFYNKLENYITKFPRSVYQITCTYIDAEGVFWFSTSGSGLSKFDPKRDKMKMYQNDPENPNSIGGNILSWVEEGNGNNLWAGSNIGLHLLNKETEQFKNYRYSSTDSSSISSSNISHILKDNEGTIWIATFDAGINKYIPESDSFERYYYRGPGSDVIHVLYEDEKNRLWVGSYNSGLLLFDKKTKKYESFILNSVKIISGGVSFFIILSGLK